jgi:hypothetical protein
VKLVLALCLSAVLAGCASFDGRGLQAGAAVADVERVMGAAAERRQVANETWYYYPRQPFGRKTFVARMGADGRLIAIEQRLTDENVAKVVPNVATQFPRMQRDIWTWHMRHFGDPGIPVSLNVQLSPDGVVREVYILDESEEDWRNGVALGLGLRF